MNLKIFLKILFSKSKQTLAIVSVSFVFYKLKTKYENLSILFSFNMEIFARVYCFLAKNKL